MLQKLTRIFIAYGVALILTGCVRNLSVEESAPDITLSPEIKAVSLAIFDERPYVLNSDKSPSFEGVIRSGFGMPYSYETSTKEPLSTYLGKRIEHGIKEKGIEVTLYPTEVGSEQKEILSALKTKAVPSIAISLKEWKYDHHALADSSWYDMNFIISDKLGNVILEKNFAGEDDIPDRSSLINEMQLLYKSRFEAAFADLEIQKALIN